MRRHGILMAFLAISFTVVAREAAAGYMVGSSSHGCKGQNAPDNFNEDVTLAPGSTTIDNGQLMLTQTIYNAVCARGELDLNFQTVGGGLLANDLGGLWEMQANGIQLSAPEFITGFYLYFTLNGTAFNPINQAPGYNLPVEPNPIDPALGPVFGTTYQNLGPFSVVDGNVSSGPYNGLSTEGVDPNTANGFHMAIMMTPVPEPSTLSLAIIGSGVIGGMVVVQRRGDRRRDTTST